jgi:1-acyl-sn-glycerol-3-phosphate acyltransferase
MRLVVRLVADVEVHGRERVPEQGSFVIATNHLGLLDAPMAYLALDRWDIFIPVAEKWERNPLLKFLGRQLNFIFIDRFNPDLKAMRKIIGLMEQGHVLIIAPEGTRSRVGSMIEGRPGVSYLAAKLDRPILPVAIYGTEDRNVIENLKRLRRTKIVVQAGQLFNLPPLPRSDRDTALRRFTDEIMCRIAVMLPERYRGVYAGHPRLKELQVA